ncbi:hypothetical protein SAMN05216480_101357 [Pustulibacterium marinum]|uniref:Ferredoxin subunit of nitrite reductase or a ring-hydroxylating dioxygenase n=1 Tax=Pustulibacterium marinum TaxID=1224947 RepID=A0A1I7EWW6_9FLAO|nr:hypothetical protein [Pustulibacterium marinum]SFU28384.1 hypothetical protein SAMN05216480_101357 [Pustulibacterium marinum]
MKKIFSLLTIVLFISCAKSDIDRNPYLSEASFSKSLNLNLPLYYNLTVPGNAVYIGDDDAGIKGIIVINRGFNNFLAWEASCPNHAPSDCSTMQVTGGVYCTCNCEGYEYNLYTGNVVSESDEDGGANYTLLYYQTYFSGNTLTISN